MTSSTGTLQVDTTDVVSTPLTALDRCDAASAGRSCGAKAYSRVTLASGGTLLFCGHHLRRHTAALAAAGAQIEDFTDEIPGGNPGASA